MAAPSSGRNVRIIEKHAHSAQYIYPLDITTPYSISSGAGAGVPGTPITIFTAGLFSEEYDLHWIFNHGLPSQCVFRIRFYIGATPRFVGEVEFIRTSNFETSGSSPIMTGDDHLTLNEAEILTADAISDVAGPITLAFTTGIHFY